MIEPRHEAQLEAQETYQGFLKFIKYASYAIIIGLLFAAGCNFGVETGPNKTGSQYNGEQYNPSNLKVKN